MTLEIKTPGSGPLLMEDAVHFTGNAEEFGPIWRKLSMMKFRILMLSLLLPGMLGLPVAMAQGKKDFWDLSPFFYSDTAPTDALAVLQKRIEAGEIDVSKHYGMKSLQLVLGALNIPVESQVLVFSKTSLQNDRIGPATPRALYFSEDAYVGYVPSGHIEVIIHDAILGPVFYLISQGREDSLEIRRDTNRCLSCHATARTEDVPGMLIRSVYAQESGHPVLQWGTHDVHHETPVADRWGGWYVTGRSAMPHLGNRVFANDSPLTPSSIPIRSVAGLVDTRPYPRPSSDIVALLVLEHQVKMHNLINAAGWNYRRSLHFMKQLNPDVAEGDGSAGGVADRGAEQIVDYLFFKDEADLGEGVEGDAGFQQQWINRFPKSKAGESLAEFRLYGRIFKNRCSYMVYSDAFRGMPLVLRKKVIARMKQVLRGEITGFEYLKPSERGRIDGILSETLDGWK